MPIGSPFGPKSVRLALFSAPILIKSALFVLVRWLDVVQECDTLAQPLGIANAEAAQLNLDSEPDSNPNRFPVLAKLFLLVVGLVYARSILWRIRFDRAKEI